MHASDSCSRVVQAWVSAGWGGDEVFVPCSFRSPILAVSWPRTGPFLDGFSHARTLRGSYIYACTIPLTTCTSISIRILKILVENSVAGYGDMINTCLRSRIDAKASYCSVNYKLDLHDTSGDWTTNESATQPSPRKC